MGYFEDAVNTGQPIVPPTPPQPAPVVPAPPTNEVQAPITPPVQGQFKGLPVRAMGDRVFLLLKGKRYWVTTVEVYNKLGFKLGDESKIDEETLAALPEGEPIR